MRLFFWTKDEWGSAFFDNLYIFGNKPSLGALGWSDKLWHFFSCWLLTIHLFYVSYIFNWNMDLWLRICLSAIVVLIVAFIWEVVVDCWILNSGASKVDIIVDIFGCIMGSFSLMMFNIGV